MNSDVDAFFNHFPDSKRLFDDTDTDTDDDDMKTKKFSTTLPENMQDYVCASGDKCICQIKVGTTNVGNKKPNHRCYQCKHFMCGGPCSASEEDMVYLCWYCHDITTDPDNNRPNTNNTNTSDP